MVSMFIRKNGTVEWHRITTGADTWSLPVMPVMSDLGVFNPKTPIESFELEVRRFQKQYATVVNGDFADGLNWKKSIYTEIGEDGKSLTGWPLVQFLLERATNPTIRLFGKDHPTPGSDGDANS